MAASSRPPTVMEAGVRSPSTPNVSTIEGTTSNQPSTNQKKKGIAARTPKAPSTRESRLCQPLSMTLWGFLEWLTSITRTLLFRPVGWSLLNRRYEITWSGARGRRDHPRHWCDIQARSSDISFGYATDILQRVFVARDFDAFVLHVVLGRLTLLR